MNIPRNATKLRWIGLISAIALLAAIAILYPAARGNKVYASQEKEAARTSAADQSTSLNDQTDLNVTVYNSNIALIRDVRNLALPGGTFRLKFMDIAATVNPATSISVRSPIRKNSALSSRITNTISSSLRSFSKIRRKEVTLARTYQESGTTKHEEIKATLLSTTMAPSGKSATTSSPECTRELSIPGSPGQSLRASHAAHVAGKLRPEEAAD